MHLLIPFAGALSDGARQALGELALPRLDALLAALTPADRDEGDEYSFSPPHERALARALGLTGDDGRLPWAAVHAAADGVEPLDLAWGELTPAHWHVGAEQVSLGNPAMLGLDEVESRELVDAVRPLFDDDGWQLVWGAPTRWYVADPSLADLACASVDRVIGRNVDLWLRTPTGRGADPRVGRLRRLQNEVQMLLFRHPLNERREDRGALPVNSFWLSGCGCAQPARRPDELIVDERLREHALAEDWLAWRDAWRALDEDTLSTALDRVRDGLPVTLELAGERHVQRFQLGGGRSFWQSLRQRWQRPPSSIAWLEAL